MHRRHLIYATALLLGLPRAAAGQEAPAPASAAIGDEMRAYYGAEKSVAGTFMALGVLSVGLGGALVPQDDDFTRGLGGSLLAVGAFEAIGAAFYGSQVDAELVDYSATLARDPTLFKAKESSHIHGTTSRFNVYRLSELGLAVLGAGTATFGVISGREGWTGAGVGVAVEATTFFVLDSLGQLRAREYEDQVRRFDPSVALQIGGGGRPWSMGIGGRF